MARSADATAPIRFAAASPDASAPRLAADDRATRLDALAARIEQGQAPDRNLDVDIYEALGFVVRRKAAHQNSRRSPAGGIYQQGSQWKSVGRISSDLSVTVDLLERLYPALSWTLRFEPEHLPACFRSDVAGSRGLSPDAARALCAATLRAAARAGPPRGQHRARALTAFAPTNNR